MHDPEDDEKITELEEKITQDNAFMGDFITLDVLYLTIGHAKKISETVPAGSEKSFQMRRFCCF